MQAYFKWHYGKAFKELLNIAHNYFLFLIHFFSIELLFKTLWSPWHRLHENYAKSLDIGNFFSSLIVNVLMRLVGFISRLVIILISFVVMAVMLIVSAIVFVFWLVSPLAIVALFGTSITLMISAT